MEKKELEKQKVPTIEFPGGPVVKTQEHVFTYMCIYICMYVYIYGASLVAQTVDSALKTYSFHLMLVYPEAILAN